LCLTDIDKVEDLLAVAIDDIRMILERRGWSRLHASSPSIIYLHPKLKKILMMRGPHRVRREKGDVVGKSKPTGDVIAK
jgi:hypothetical protein